MTPQAGHCIIPSMPLSVYSMCVDPLLRSLRNYIVDLAGIRPGQSALDVGCGTGEQVFSFIRAGIQATGIDMNPAMIRTANALRNRHGFTSAAFHLANATELPFAAHTFDFASISLVLHETSPEVRLKIISEMRRVVKSQGTMVFVDFGVPLPRNIPGMFARIVEYLAGETNYRHFRSYLQGGGLGELLSEGKLQPKSRTVLFSGTFTLITVVNENILYPG